MQNNMINRNDPRTQLDPVLEVRPKSTFFRDHFFKGSDEHFMTENIEWDRVIKGAPMARFVGDGLVVEPTERVPYRTDEIKTPRIQERKIISEGDIATRMPGENIYMSQTPAERAAKLHAEDVIFCLDAIDNRIEVMCSQMITAGRIPIVGLGVSREIDFQIPNKTALGPGSRWGDPNVNILDSMREQVDLLGEYGYTVDEIIMSPEVWAILYNDSKIQKLLDITNYGFGELKPEKLSKYGAAKPVGLLTDPYVKLYTQNSSYGGKNNRTRHLPQDTVLFISEEARQNKLGFGAVTIKEKDGTWKTVVGRYVQQFFEKQDPPRDEVRVTSRPVTLPKSVESWAIMKVR